MKKFLLTFLIGTILLSSTVVPVSAKNLVQTNKTKIHSSENVSEKLKISSNGVDSNGSSVINVSFDKFYSNTKLVILDNGKILSEKKITNPCKDVNVDVTLTYYLNHELTAFLANDSELFDPYVRSNSINLGYFDPQVKEQIQLSYVSLNNIDTNFNVILPYKDQNPWLYVYDNGVLMYKAKLTNPTDKINFTAPLKGFGRHDIKAYLGANTVGVYKYEPFMSSNTVTIFN